MPQLVLAPQVPDAGHEAFLDPGRLALAQRAGEPRLRRPELLDVGPEHLALLGLQRHHGIADIGRVCARRGEQRDRDAGGRALDAEHRKVADREALDLQPGLRPAADVAAVGALRDDPLKPVRIGRPEERRALARRARG